MVNMKEVSFFSNPGGINTESIRQTIVLARNNAAGRRSRFRQRRRQLDDDAGENVTTQLFSTSIECTKDAYDIAEDVYDDSTKLIRERRNEFNEKSKCLEDGEKSERYIETAQGGQEMKETVEAEKFGDLLRRVMSEKSSPVVLDRKPKSNSAFDPSELEGVKRAAIAAKKRERDKEAAHAEAISLASFKARPLPGGIWVENDIFATTQAARGKDKRVCPKSVEIDQKMTETNTPGSLVSFKRGRRRKDPSPSLASHSRRSSGNKFQLSTQSTLSCVDSCLEGEAFPCSYGGKSPKASRTFCVDMKELALKRGIRELGRMALKAKEINCPGSICTEKESSVSDAEDEISLEREVAKLEAQLTRKRKLVLELSALLDDEDTHIIDNSNNGGCTWNLVTGENEGGPRKQTDDEFEKELVCDQWNVGSMLVDNMDPGNVVYRRQERWLQKKEHRLREYRVNKAKEVMDGFTCVPELSGASQSWEKAKTAHAKAIQQQREEERRREKEKGARFQLVEAQKEKEIDEMRADAEKRKRSKKTTADREKQQEALYKPARSRVTRRVSKEVEEKAGQTPVRADNDGGKTTSKSSLDRNLVRSAGRNVMLPLNQISFADMDDKQFARVMKSVGIDTSTQKQRKRCEAASCSVLLMSKIVNVNTSPSHLHSSIGNSGSSIDAENDRTKNALVTSLTGPCAPNSFSFVQPDLLLLSETDLQPYQKYEAGKVPFFDKTSSADIGRFRVRCATYFASETMRRKPDIESGIDGVMLLVGKLKNCEQVDEDFVITILFDRARFSEQSASKWWWCNRSRFVNSKQLITEVR